jgi:hypothetical protein
MQYVELITAVAKVILAFFKAIPEWIRSGKISNLEKERERLSKARDAISWAKFLGK